MKMIERAIVKDLQKRLASPPNLLQIVTGPRQVGKTTALEQVLKKWKGPTHYASADLPSPPDAYWIEAQWKVARVEAGQGKTVLLVLDEVQKIHRWAEVVKGLFDEDHRKRLPIRAVLLGSAALILQKDAQESLAGRFERHFCSHWSWPECKEAFGWDLDEWIYFGGYPRGASVQADTEQRWASYISDSLIDSVLSRDVLQTTPIAKPALLRQLFMLAVRSPAQILSYNKMLGQLQDAGNTVTLAHYLDILSSAYLVSGLQQWSGGVARARASSPKLVIWNNALINALSHMKRRETQGRSDLWGRLVENAVGAYILNQAIPGLGLYYWRHRDNEVDYVLEMGKDILLIEVKSGVVKSSQGLDAFRKQVPRAKALLVGSGGVPLETFFSTPTTNWL